MKNGIAMATLVVIISVMIILVSVITVTGFNTSNTARKLAFASELEMIQESVNSYKTDNEGDLPISDFIVIDLTRASGDVLNQFQQNGEEITNNKVSLCKIDFNKLNVKSLTRGVGKTEDDIYVISNKTGIVYYAKGLKIGTKTYYTLTDELKNLINYNAKSSEVNVDNEISFILSEKGWTNSEIITVRLPKACILRSFSIDGVNNISSISTVGGAIFNEYSITLTNNCTVEVTYLSSNSEEKQARFDVTNIDRNNPYYEVKSINVMGDKKYVEIDYGDTISGIKSIKYLEGNISNDKLIFENNGIDVKGNIIELDKDVNKISLYFEDNAGNYIFRKENI